MAMTEREAMIDRLSADLANNLPDMPTEETVSILMSALERYSIKAEGPGETGLRGIVYGLRDALEERMQSF